MTQPVFSKRTRIIIEVAYGIAIGLSVGVEVIVLWALMGLPS